MTSNSKWLPWFDRALAITLIVVHGAGVLDHFKNYVRASLATWIPVLIVVLGYVLFWALYIFRIRYHGFYSKAIARLLLIFASVAVILMFTPPGYMVAELSPELQMLVADVENKTGDSGFSVDAIKRTLTIALKESPEIAILPDNRLQDTLRRMGKPPNERISVDIGREVCQREGVGLLVAPVVSKDEEKYILEAQVLDPKTGEVLYETTVGASGMEGITDTVSKLANDLRNRFGESRWDLYRKTKPLAAATSKSLDALELYSQALEDLGEAKYTAAAEKLNKALGLDSDFALAWVELASIYDLQGKMGDAIACSTRAFSLRDRLTEPERVRVDDFYYWHVENNHEKAFTELTEFLRKYPKNQDRFASLSYEAHMLMKFDVAEEAIQDALGKRPWGESSEESSYALWQIQLSRDKFPQALETASYIKQDIPKAAYLPYVATIPKLVSGDKEAAKLEILHLRQTNNTDAALWIGGLFEVYEGKLQSASDQWLQYARSIEQPEKSESWTTPGNVYLALMRIALLAGKKNEARLYLKKVQGVRDEYFVEAGKYYARLGDLKEAGEVLDELRKRLAGRETNQNRALLELLEGEIELARGNKDKSFTLISSAATYPWAYSYFSVQESLGNAALASGRNEIAIQAFKSIVDRKGFAADREHPEIWIMAHYDTGRSYQATGNNAMARSYYLQFEQLWGGADATLPVLVELRKHLSETER